LRGSSSRVLLELPPPTPCEVIQRRNRFVVEVSVGGRRAAASINNTGRLLEYLVPGRTAYCLERAAGRTGYRLIAVKEGESAALVDTQLQMRAFENLLGTPGTPWEGCRVAARAPRVGESVLDYLLSCSGERVYTELKSAVLREGFYAMYPDCPTLRGRRHVKALIELAEAGARTLIVFVAALPGVTAFKPYEKGDPVIAQLLRQAREAGVALRAVSMHYEPEPSRVILDNPSLPVHV